MTATLDRPEPPVHPPVKQPRNAMRKVAMRSLAAHKMRFLLTLLSVVLGTAFVAGSFVLTNALGSSINDIAGGSLKNTDVVVSPEEGAAEGLPMTMVETLKGVSGVEGVEPSISGTVSLLDASGKAVTTSGAPIQGGSWTEGSDNATSVPDLIEGRAPTGNNEVVINEAGLEKTHLKVGDKTKVLLPEQGMTEVTVVGSYTVDFATGGWIGVFFSPEQARQYFLQGNQVPLIAVRGADSLSQSELKARVDSVLPATAVAETGEAYLDKQAEQIETAMGFVNTFLLVFGIIGIGVGASLIYITFSMVIAQRLRELALLRAIGASRGQIMRSVLAEGLLVGIVGSVVGVLLGWAIAYGMLQLMESTMGMPVGNVAITWQAVAWAVGLGVFITVVSSVAPAVRAGNTAPVEAMRGVHATPKSGKARWIIGSLIFLAGIALTALGVAQSTLWMLGAGFALVLVGLVFLSAYIAPRVFSLFRPITQRTPMGRLAHGNTIRNPKRTAATAFALAIGMALVTAFSIIGASAKSTFTDVLTQGQKWTYAASSQQAPIPPVVLKALEDADGVADTVSMGFSELPAKDGQDLFVNSIRGNLSAAMDTSMEEGSSDLGPNSILVSKQFADGNDWKLGDTIDVPRPDGSAVKLEITGIMKSGGFLEPAVVSSQVSDQFTPPHLRMTFMAFSTLEPGADSATVRANLDEAVKDYPMTRILDQDELVRVYTAQIDMMLAILYGLLGLALVISILGIVNTLALAVVERTREVGMMRAIGAQRGQIRKMITGESVLICIYGAMLGLVIGLVYGRLFVGQLADLGLTSQVIPWGSAAGFFIAAIVVGLLAAVWPAMKAARTRPLEAITED